MRNECPDCRGPLKANARSCICGWSATLDAIAPQRKYETCDYCNVSYLVNSKSLVIPRDANRIIGRSKSFGWICRDCYERPAEPDWRDKALAIALSKNKGAA